MRLVIASLIVVLTAMSYGLEALGLALVLGVAPVRLLVLVLSAIWALIEGLVIVKKVGTLTENIAQANLVKDAARREAEDAREELRAVRQEVQLLKQKPKDESALQVLSLLQQKGRFLDFVMDDVTKYPDAQIGAAARVVHQGCASVVREYFDVQPVEGGAEGGAVTLEKNYDSGRYRLVGRVTGEAPYRGRILHRGWLTTSVRLPERTKLGEHGDGQGVIAPAEVEVS
jgi:hypothetical protein